LRAKTLKQVDYRGGGRAQREVQHILPVEDVIGFLSPDELTQLLPAETSAFPSPIPTQSVSSDEFMPLPRNAKQRTCANP